MKLLLLLVAVLVAVGSVQSQEFPTAKCPPGEHSVLYCPQRAEPSCDNPSVHDLPADVPSACGIPDCFCNTPTVRNIKTGKCVKISECKH